MSAASTVRGGSSRARSMLRSRTAAQTAVFTASSGLIGVLGGIGRALLAAMMSVSAFGAFSFATSFLQFAALLFEFGLFLPASRLAARAREGERRQIIGAALLTYVPVGIAFALTVFGLSFVVDSLFKVDAGEALRIAAPLSLAFPFSMVALQLTQGVDRLHVYSLTSLAAQFLFVAALLVIEVAHLSLGTTGALVLRSAALLVGGLLLAAWLRPVFLNAKDHARELTRQARAYGFQVYVGRVLSVGSYNMDVLMLGALTNARTVGVYTLAVAFTQAVGLPITGMSTTLFPRMARDQHISRGWLTIAWVVGLGGAFATWALYGPVIGALFSSAYLGATAYILPLALAQAVRGVTTVYNQYLSAQARGRELRNAGLILTGSNLVLNFALIPRYGAAGAAWASLVALVLNLVAHVIGYRRALRAEADAKAAAAPAQSPLPVTQSGSTDLEAAGLALGQADPHRRYWVLTVDFEAFAGTTDPARWTAAMRRFAERSEDLGLRFEIFLSVEDAVRLRHEDEAAYRDFVSAAREMEAAGSRFHAHNHCVFDLDTGAVPSAYTGFPQIEPDYRKRASMFYDVVHRHRADLADWMQTVDHAYEDILRDGGLTRPDRAAFRPGGWDNGDTADDLRAYVSALRRVGYSIDSSATAGEFNTPSWRVGAPFGTNAYWLEGGLLELAVSSSLDCGVDLLSRTNAGAAREIVAQPALWRGRGPGIHVTVVHFDHLFHRWRNGRRETFAVLDDATVRRRIDRFTSRLKHSERLLGVRIAGFEDLEFAQAPPLPAEAAQSMRTMVPS